MRLLPLLFLPLIPSCSSIRDEESPPVESATRPSLVGRVASLPAGGDFVLIEAYGPWRVPEGGLLTTVGAEGRTANLVVTGEKLGRHAAADLRSGAAEVGDSVYYRPVKEPGELAEGENSAAGGGEGTGELKKPAVKSIARP
jgi:hypothetical protein